MTVDEAVRYRINELLLEKKMTISEVSLAGGLTPSTLYDFMRGTTAHIQLNTLKCVCMGFELSLSSFFDKEYFNDYE
ncbi:MAG: helix-turn-helix transcriptional regulator [Clostridia bacterium]|nr:helix-turn-helix transcriptional regulator [Clostridia bacterium]